jgi:AmiR/NasT family two-component response regulator
VGGAGRQCTGSGYALLVSKTPFNVVIAEDEALIRLDLREMLEEEGYVVAGEASDGETAVQLAEQLKPELVIMDVKMPGLDGISAAERITANQVAPVIILTAFSQRDLVQRASEAGAMAYLIKPFTKADLVPAIEVAVSRFAEIAALNAEAASLRDRLEVRKLLDRAKGALQDGRGMTEAQAFRYIQKTSMDRRQTMRAVAEEVLAEAEKAAADSAPNSGSDAGGGTGTGGRSGAGSGSGAGSRSGAGSGSGASTGTATDTGTGTGTGTAGKGTGAPGPAH